MLLLYAASPCYLSWLELSSQNEYKIKGKPGHMLLLYAASPCYLSWMELSLQNEYKIKGAFLN